MYILVFILSMFGCGDSSSSSPESPTSPVAMPAGPQAVLFRLQGAVEVETQKNASSLVKATLEGIEGEIHVRNAETWAGMQGALRIPLAAFNSGLELRDTRIQELFFSTKQWPMGVLEFSLQKGFGKPLGPGESQLVSVPGVLTLGGGQAEVEMNFKISRSGERSFSVVSETPLLLSIAGLGLSEPLAKLVELCAHDSVRDEVKVSFRASISD